MQTATNPETGEVAVLVGNEWVKAERTATNDKGEKAYLVGGKWLVKDAPAPIKLGADALPDHIKAEAESRSLPAQFIAGAGTALDNAAMRLKQLVSGLSPEDELRVSANRALASTTAGLAGNVAGNVAMVATPAGAAQRAATAAAGRMLPAIAAPTVAAAATGGAVSATTNPVLSGESELVNAGMGALGGAAGDAVARGLARVAQPVIASKAAEAAAKRGIATTPGQAAGGILNRVEQQLESLPVVGWFLTGARERAVKEANAEAIRRAIPKGTEHPGIGREAVERAGEVLDDAYNAVYARLSGKFKADAAFQSAIKNLPKANGIDLPPSLEKRFERLMQDRVTARLAGGAGAEAVRDVHNSLGALARKYRASGSPDERSMGVAFSEAKKAFREMLSRQSGSNFKQALDALDDKYSALLAVEKAAGYQGSKEGVFSAEALRRASGRAGPAFKEFAAETADVLGRTVPDSGTAGRALLPLTAYALGGGAAGANEYMGGPAWITGAALAPLLYSRPGVRYLSGQYPGQATLATTLRDLSPYFAQAGRSVAQ